MNVLIIGGTGFIGKNLSKRLTKENHNVFIIGKGALKQPNVFDIPIADIKAIENLITENNIGDFEKAVDASFFIQILEKKQWVGKSEADKLALLQKMADVKEGISFPVLANGSIVYNPDELYVFLDHYFAKKSTLQGTDTLQGCHTLEGLKGLEL